MKQLAKDKSPRPNGWPVEFFLSFLDMLMDELLHMVEQSKVEGFVSDTLNSTFSTTTPNKNKPKTINDYSPISLCNLAYKIITKIISNRLRTRLADMMSKEQFGFFGNRQILDVVGVTQECLHSIK